jgi:hypothetical protein
MRQGVRRAGAPTAPALLGLLWLAAFALLFTLGSSVGLWPLAADPRLSRLELPAGLVFGLALAATLLRARPAAAPPPEG